MQNRSTGKRIALGFSVLSFASAIAAIVLLAFVYPQRGAADPVTASLLATIFFLASCSVVLYFISQPPRYELLPWDQSE